VNSFSEGTNFVMFTHPANFMSLIRPWNLKVWSILWML